MTATPNHALQRTAPRVTARAFCERSAIYIWASVVRSTLGHAPRHAPPSLSLGSLGVATSSVQMKSQSELLAIKRIILLRRSSQKRLLAARIFLATGLLILQMGCATTNQSDPVIPDPRNADGSSHSGDQRPTGANILVGLLKMFVH